jgi:hypothetical protein
MENVLPFLCSLFISLIQINVYFSQKDSFLESILCLQRSDVSQNNQLGICQKIYWGGIFYSPTVSTHKKGGSETRQRSWALYSPNENSLRGNSKSDRALQNCLKLLEEAILHLLSLTTHWIRGARGKGMIWVSQGSPVHTDILWGGMTAEDHLLDELSVTK